VNFVEPNFVKYFRPKKARNFTMLEMTNSTRIRRRERLVWWCAVAQTGYECIECDDAQLAMRDLMYGWALHLKTEATTPVVTEPVAEPKHGTLQWSFRKINVKKLQFIHTLTATDVRASKTAKIKKLITIALHIVIRQCVAA